MNDLFGPAQLRIKILTIRQPWAWLIVSGQKDVENRSWRTRYRGPVLIHAGKQIDERACELHAVASRDLQSGGIIGVAEIVDCVATHQSRWFEGPFGLLLKRMQELPFLPICGQLGLCDAPPELLQRIDLKHYLTETAQ